MNKLLKQAFTLIELLVVIAIIGILSGLIIVGMSGMTQKATIAKAQVFSNSLRNSLMMNIVGEWKFDGATSERPAVNADVVDSWGGVNNGTIPASPSIPTIKTESNCVSGSCLSFDGVDDYVDCGNNINIVGPYTIEEWIKMSANTGNTNERTVNLGATIGGLPLFSPNFWNTNKPLIYLGEDNYRYGSTNVADDKWHHIVFVMVGAAQNDIINAKIYIDGKEETYTATTNSGAPSIPSGHAWIGTDNIHTFNGSIDDVRIYGAAMPTSQIEEEYYSGLNKLLTNGSIYEKEYIGRINEAANSISTAK